MKTNRAKLIDKASSYARLMRFDRPIGTLLLLWPTLWGLWLASGGAPRPLHLVVFVLGVLVMRAAGCVINDYADRDLDPHVARTRHRPLATGEVSPREAIVLFIVLCAVAFGLVCLLNRLAIALSFVGAALAASYPFMKRYTYLPQVHLGVAFGWGVPISFAAETGTVPPHAWLLLVGVVVWAVAYDTMYAMVDREDDLRIGVKSTAILFGEADRLWIGLSQIGLFAILLLLGHQLELGLPYVLGVAGAAASALYQQYLIRDRAPARCFKAFLNNNWLGAAVFAGLAVDLAM
jgi:4-hydroxybenzoate polyprenyltransferase